MGGRRALAAVGAVLAAGCVLVPRAQAARSGGVPGLVAVVTVVACVGARAATRRRDPYELLGPGGTAPLFAAIGLADAGLLMALAAYVGPLPGFVLAGLAGALAGSSWWQLRRLAVGTRTAALGTATFLAGGILAGGLAAVALAPLVLAVSRFAATRSWHLALAETPVGMRAAVLVAAVMAVVGAVDLASASTPAPGPSTPAGGGPPVRRRRPDALLEVQGLDVAYGPVQVLFGVDLHVEQGESLALLGTNGAGKSTVLRAVFGLTPPSAGRVTFAGAEVTGFPAERLVGAGMVQVPGGKGVFPSLSVHDNLLLAGYHHKAGDRRIREGIDRTLAAFPRLVERLDRPAGVLSGGEQQMVALARAWIARPRLLAIDELTLGLDPTVVGALLEALADLRSEGVSLIIVEQSVHVALELAERAVFLERGEVRFDGPTADLTARDDLLRSIFFAGAAEAIA